MRREKSYAGIVVIFIFLLIIAGAVYVYNSKQFERTPPKIIAKNTIYWNIKTPLKIVLKDNSGIKFVHATLSDGKNSIVLVNKIYNNPQKDLNLFVKSPNNSFIYQKQNFTLQIKAVDSSKWNFFSGNQAIKNIHIVVDTKRPELGIIDNSYGIRECGGTALVIFQAKDKNMKNLYIQTSFGKRFYPTPFYKKGYYISLLAWPVRANSFNANIVAIDKAGNISRAHIPLYFKSKRYKKATITITDRVLHSKVADFVSNVVPQISNKTPVEQYVYINQTVRKKNEDLIDKVTSKVSQTMIKNFNIKPFHPLIDAEPVAHFDDHRTYYYKGKKISTSYHLGIDLASIARAKIRASNNGIVAFSRFNGIYGNNLIINHGLGLYTLFGHCSKFLVQKGDSVKRGQVVARTGQTGMAFGDHLHFGVYVQGVAVYPKEWMDRHWIKLNITDIIKEAKKIINKSSKN